VKTRWGRALAVTVGWGLAIAACSNQYLYDPKRADQIPSDRTVSIVGDFCTPAANEVIRPIKIVVAMDASQSMAVTDPNGTRALALINLIDTLPQEKEIYIATLLFAGSTPYWATKTRQNKFDAIVDMSVADRTWLKQTVLNYTVPGNMANRDSTDFIKPLSDIYAMINSDIAAAAQASDGGTGQVAGRYSVIFLSDGQPTFNQDDELLCGDAVTRIRQLKDLCDDVRVNTVHVFTPSQPIASTACTFDAGVIIPATTGNNCRIPNLPPGACPLLIVNQNAQRLEKMAELGGGDFRDFRNNEPINFLNFRFGNVRRNYVFNQLIASNFSAPPDSSPDAGDTDGDGLTDAEEAIEGTNPWVADTDGDGFSDGVEVYGRNHGANFTPNQVALPDGGGLDPGCPPELRGVDSDCDGLTDCDEQIIGTNARRQDSDDDGIPDAVEWKGLTQPSSKDLDQDPDNDRLSNAQELLMHTNPLVVDAQNLSTIGYRYTMVRDGGIDALGRQCYSFRIDNVLLVDTAADTRDAGNPDGGADLYRRGGGYNDIYLSQSMVPGDDPAGHTLIKQFRHFTSRFPEGGIKSPVDGVIRVSPDDFKTGCDPALFQSLPP
jgi:hypothetical protein